MGLLTNWLKKQPNIVYDEGDSYSSDKVGSIQIPDTLTNTNAFTLANTVTEIYWAVDFHADRASKLRYFLADKAGNEIQDSEYNRFLNSINPLYSFTDLIYQYIFSYLSDGNAITYVNVPGSYKKPSVNSITRLDVLQPNLLTLNEYTNISLLDVQNLNDLIRQARYSQLYSTQQYLDLTRLRIDTIDATRRDGSMVLSQSPLFKCIRPINNLLATYSARYNVYANNGAAGYLVKKQANNQSLESVIDPKGREDMLRDINNRMGITGKRHLWGISGIPMEFINTLSDIQKLMPFEETLEDSIKIASVNQIPPELVPRKDQSTFNNKAETERSVWENGLMSIIGVACQNFTKALYLDKVGIQIKADYSTVSCLKLNESNNEDLYSKRIANLKAIKEANPEKANDVNKELDKILVYYGQR